MGPAVAPLVFPCADGADIAGGAGDDITGREASGTRPVEVEGLGEVEPGAWVGAATACEAEAEVGVRILKFVREDGLLGGQGTGGRR